MWKIRENVLKSIAQAATNTFPNEFIAFLGGNKKTKTIEELIILPSVFGTEQAIIRSDLLPLGVKTFGSVHSHRGGSNFPSRQDKKMFAQTGEIHFIICEPFLPENIRAFGENGKETAFETIP